MKIAIIPARCGSKRLPGKNIKEFCGKPIIAYSIETALKANIFNKVIVSTDDIKIAEIAKRYGAEIPFLRPKDISDDFTTSLEVMEHSVRWCTENFQEKIVKVCCLYPTAPFVTANHLNKAVELLKDDVKYVISSTEFSFNIFRAFKINDNDRTQMFWPDNFAKRSQDLEKAYHDAGMFYIGKPEAFLQKRPFFDTYSVPYLLPHYLVQDIDTYEDWERAELMYKLIMEKNDK